jgi:hypothetical protein
MDTASGEDMSEMSDRSIYQEYLKKLATFPHPHPSPEGERELYQFSPWYC